MNVMYRLMIVAALALMLVACSDSTKPVVDNEDQTDYTMVDTDTTGYDEDLAGDKDDLFAEGTLNDDGTGQPDETVTDPVIGPDEDVPQNDGIGTDDILTDEEETPDGDGLLVPDKPQKPDDLIPDSDQIMVEQDCAEGYYLLRISVYYRVGSENIDGGGTYTTTPAGQLSIGADPQPICYLADSTVAIHLTIEDGYTFSQWRGPDRLDVSGTFPDFSITMDADKRISAQVTPD